MKLVTAQNFHNNSVLREHFRIIVYLWAVFRQMVKIDKIRVSVIARGVDYTITEENSVLIQIAGEKVMLEVEKGKKFKFRYPRILEVCVLFCFNWRSGYSQILCFAKISAPKAKNVVVL